MDIMISYILQSQLFMPVCVCVCTKKQSYKKYPKKNYSHYLQNCAKNMKIYQHPYSFNIVYNLLPINPEY